MTTEQAKAVTELELLDRLMQSEIYQDFISQFKGHQDADWPLVTSAPQDLAGVIAREQAIGSIAVYSTVLGWFDARRDAARDIVKDIERTQ